MKWEGILVAFLLLWQKKFNEKQHMGGQDLFSLPFQVMVHDSGEVKTGTQAPGHFTSIVKRKRENKCMDS